MRYTYSTEFPAADTSTVREFAEVGLSWAKKIKSTRLFEPDANVLRSEDDEIKIRSVDDSEALQIKTWRDGLAEACGLRHTRTSANEGIAWETECVLSITPDSADISLRGMCLGLNAKARPERPKKPVLLSALLHAGFGGEDGPFLVGRKPHIVDRTRRELSQLVRTGDAGNQMPVVIASRGPQEFTRTRLNRFAGKELSGVAHLVSHASAHESSRLASLPGPSMPREGALALAIPGRGIVRRYFLGPLFKDHDAIQAAVVEDIVSHLETLGTRRGLGWTEVQDRHAAMLRGRLIEERKTRERARADDDLAAKLETAKADLRLMEEMSADVEANKDERIGELESQLETAREALSNTGRNPLTDAERVFAPLYTGELGDRLARILESAIETDKLSSRDREALSALRDAFTSSGRASQLIKRIKETASDPRNQAHALGAALLETGYRQERNNKHVVFVREPTSSSLPPFTVHKTPSDHRASKNLASELINHLDIRRL